MGEPLMDPMALELLHNALSGVSDPKKARKIITHSGLVAFDKIDPITKGWSTAQLFKDPEGV